MLVWQGFEPATSCWADQCSHNCANQAAVKHEDDKTPYHISIYDKRDDFNFQNINFPHMDSNIPGNLAYGVYISQLVRHATVCTSKVDFLHSDNLTICYVTAHDITYI